MDNLQEQAEVQEQSKLVVSEEMRSHFYEIAKWANFLAVVGFVFTALMIISAFTVGAVMNTNPQMAMVMGKLGSGGGIIFTIVFLLFAFAIFYPSLLMFKYSTKAKMGVLYGEQASLDEAIGKLKSLFKYWGIIIMIYIGFYVLMIIAQATGGVAGV